MPSATSYKVLNTLKKNIKLKMCCETEVIWVYMVDCKSQIFVQWPIPTCCYWWLSRPNVYSKRIFKGTRLPSYQCLSERLSTLWSILISGYSFIYHLLFWILMYLTKQTNKQKQNKTKRERKKEKLKSKNKTKQNKTKKSNFYLMAKTAFA